MCVEVRKLRSNKALGGFTQSPWWCVKRWRKRSNAVGSLRQRSWLDRTVTSVWQRKRAFDNVHTPPRGED